MTWEVVVPIPAHPGFGFSRHAPPVEALRNGHRRASSRFWALSKPGSSVGGAAEGSTRHEIEGEKAGEAVNAPRRGSTRHVNAPRAAEAWAARRERMRAFLARGRAFRAWLDEAEGRSTKHLAEKEGISRPRVCQLLVLTRLAPEILADLDDVTLSTPTLGERELRDLAVLPAVQQVWKYMEATGALLNVSDARRVAKLAGFQHLFARARRLRDLYATGNYRSLNELGKADGISGARASALLNMLLMAPEVIAQLDVPKEEAPRLAEREVRRLARMLDHGEQRVVFERMVRAVAG